MTDDIDKPLRVALPNKGRLSEKALELFEQAGLKATFRADRALMASLGPDFQAIMVRAGDIPEFLADGAAEVGVTGADLVAESGQDLVEILENVRGRDVFILQPTCEPTNDNLMEILLLCDALRRASVGRMTAVVRGAAGSTDPG